MTESALGHAAVNVHLRYDLLGRPSLVGLVLAEAAIRQAQIRGVSSAKGVDRIERPQGRNEALAPRLTSGEQQG